MPFSRFTILRAAMLGISVVLHACYSQPSVSAASIPFAIRIVDDGGDTAIERSGRSDLVPNFKGGGAIWLKRQGGIERVSVSDAHSAKGEDGSTVVDFTLNSDVLGQLAALTRENIGHRLAMVVNGKVVLNTLIAGEAPRDPVMMLSGDFTDDEARTIAAGMIQASRAP